MKRFWEWLTMSDIKRRGEPAARHRYYANADYRSRLDVKVDVSGDIDYVLRILPIIAKQLEATDSRPADAT